MTRILLPILWLGVAAVSGVDITVGTYHHKIGIILIGTVLLFLSVVRTVLDTISLERIK